MKSGSYLIYFEWFTCSNARSLTIGGTRDCTHAGVQRDGERTRRRSTAPAALHRVRKTRHGRQPGQTLPGAWLLPVASEEADSVKL